VRPPREHAGERSLPPAGIGVLELLWQHRLLSSSQLKRLVAPEASDAYLSGILCELEQRQLIAFVRMRARGAAKVWFLTDRGGDVVAAAPTKAEPRRLILSQDSAAGGLQAHTLAVNEVGILFVEAARRRGDECGPLAWQHEIQHRIAEGQGRRRSGAESVQADALLNYAVILPEGRVELRYLFLELDRATEPADVLAGKLRQYARLYHHKPPTDADDPLAGEPGWRYTYPLFPEVLVVLAGKPGPALERRISLVKALARQDPICRSTPEMQVSFTILDELAEHGPFAPVFIPLNAADRVDFLGQPGLATLAARELA
jgi:hypothetical protein